MKYSIKLTVILVLALFAFAAFLKTADLGSFGMVGRAQLRF